MEDGSDGLPSDPPLPEPMKNGEVMARLQEEGSNDKEDESKLVKVNGSSILEETKSEESDSSDYDALVIDESATSKKELRKPKATKAGFKGFKNSTNEELDSYMHSNPYFAESIFELFEKSQEKKGEGKLLSEDRKACSRHIGERKKGKSNPKLREYAQYLGLQPTVQFKCSKCSRAGFQSLASLNYHILRCDDTAPPNGVSGTAPPGPPSTNFRVTRKVFLCSACGTYYENWNLFLHMREVHKRYICLYCLGMFSHPEKLSLHIVSKHNCVPSRINTLEEFYDAHKEPCFLMCCECQKGFTESDNFFQHQCAEVGPKAPLKTAVPVKQSNPKNQKNVEHVTADSVDGQQNSEQDFFGEVQKETPADAETVEKERAPPLETVETTQQGDNITCDSTLTQTDSQTALFEDAERMQNDGEVSFRGSDEESSLISPGAAEKHSDEEEDERVEREPAEEGVGETRKVPKVTLKFKDFEYLGPPDESRAPQDEDENCESDDSEKLTMEVDRIEDESREDSRGPAPDEGPVAENDGAAESQTMQVAGTDVPIVELELEQPLDRFEVKRLLQKCLRTTIATCVYCNHARRISVNGKQLGLHAIAEHRFSAVVNSITAEELIPESFVARITDGLSELDGVHFNLEDGDDSTIAAFAHVFECFQCRYSTAVHKELYLHNRKMHAKSILLCIMCKSNFYSYSELICHLCPGVYDVERDVRFRCCVCVGGGDELPSAFRLMVHLRKRHNACDVCLEPCHNQSKLSNHVWKHKLHHLCYRCGIAYRNKPDITKHLFWKHGTESVLCKKCLQKKWPHVYHFCILPPSFVCEECNLSFSKAVYLMVHKRLHSDVRPHVCSEEACGERFVSKKLLLKHEFKHREPIEAHHVEPEKPAEQAEPPVEVAENSSVQENADADAESEKGGEKPKAKVDVYDLPELNLSESDSSESGDEAAPKSAERCVDETGEKPVLETIWDDFRNYRANQDQESTENNPPVNLEAIMGDHDYCVVLEKPESGKEGQAGDLQQPDHDYCFGPKKGEADVSVAPAKSSSDSSSDSDSSSCTCGSNCSCSSSSGNNSSSSDSSSSDSSSSEGRRRQQARRERRRQKAKSKKKGADENSGNGANAVAANDSRAPPPTIGPAIAAVPVPEVPIQESDLETTESDTDEDFYDEQPQKLADKLLAEKKNQLLQVAAIGPYINGSIMDGSRPPTPGGIPAPPSTVAVGGGSVKKKKSKSKKRKKKSRRDGAGGKYESVSKRGGASPARDFACPAGIIGVGAGPADGRRDGESRTAAEMDSSLRASKRRRVPNKFYGYSSDEERERVQPPALKWRKVDLPAPVPPRSPLVVPPLTIKTTKPPESTAAIAPSETFRPADFHHQHYGGRKQFRPPPPIQPVASIARRDRESAATDSNESSSDEEETHAECGGGSARPPVPPPNTQPQPALYCYCRCPYDEVSEMIGCDSSDCAIEWFHFECVGIMVPPKGQWFCPDCRKKKQQRREMLHMHGHAV